MRQDDDISSCSGRQLPPRAGSTSPSQSAIIQWGWLFRTLRDGIDPGGQIFVPGVLGCRCMEGFQIRRWEPINPWCIGALTLYRGATPAACWLHEPQPIGNQQIEVRFHRYRSGGSPFRPRVVGSCICTEGFLIQGWDLLAPLAFPHRAGRYRPGGPHFSIPGYWVADEWQGFRSGDGTIPSHGASEP